MKLIWSLLPPAVKAIAMVIIFFISLGWASYGAVLLIVQAEGNDIRREVKEIREIDMKHVNEKFSDNYKYQRERFDRLERLIIRIFLASMRVRMSNEEVGCPMMLRMSGLEVNCPILFWMAGVASCVKRSV